MSARGVKAVMRKQLSRRSPKTLGPMDSSTGYPSTPSAGHKSAVLPWGSLRTPDFGRMRKDTNLTPQQMDSLVRQHLPAETVDVCRQRNKVVRMVHRLMAQKKSKELEQELEKLQSNIVPLDEVTYVTMVFGYLLLPHHGLPAAYAVLARMKSVDHMHPALLEMVGTFLSSLEALDKFDSFPNRTAILKGMLPFQEIATEVRRMRMLGFRVAMSDQIKSGQIRAPPTK